MDKINSKMFFQTWCKVVNDRKESLLKIWRNSGEFTLNVKGDDASIMKEVANQLDLLCYHGDYYCLDAVLYKKEDLVPDLPTGYRWLRDIRVAFEHENKCNHKLYEEVSHLLITNCDLRVLVTYPSDDGRKHDSKNTLNRLTKLIQGNRQSQKISDDENFLVIFGSEGDFSWDGYVYKQDEWKRLN